MEEFLLVTLELHPDTPLAHPAPAYTIRGSCAVTVWFKEPAEGEAAGVGTNVDVACVTVDPEWVEACAVVAALELTADAGVALDWTDKDAVVAPAVDEEEAPAAVDEAALEENVLTPGLAQLGVLSGDL